MEDGAVGLRSAASTEHLSHFLVSLATVYGVGMLESGLSVLRTFLFAGWMGRERYGAFTLATSLVTFLLPLAGLQISSAFSRYVPEYERRGSLRIFLRRSFAIVAVSSAVFFLVSQAAAERLARLVFQQEGYAPLFRLASLGLVFTSFYSVGLAALRGLRMFRSTSALELLKTAVFTALGAALLLAAGRRAEWAITANLIAVGGVAAVFAATLTRRGRSWPRTADIEPLGPFARRLL
ncbi:MAG: oligosaccharide flippase family protein, partial [Candidatus Sumerlaeota bacterium]|nr:oligosaccharide flippase family protein [Candidatus Sumerlaeota bacterium]